MRELFASFGTIKDVKVIYDDVKGYGKGYGFVTFSSKEEANKAVRSLNKCEFKGRKLQVSIKS